ncbi:hypothetical protein ACWF50_13505 [Brucella pseudogrignonensis]
MPDFRFSEDFDWTPLSQVTIAYKADWSDLVIPPCANSADESSKAARENSERK